MGDGGDERMTAIPTRGRCQLRVGVLLVALTASCIGVPRGHARAEVATTGPRRLTRDQFVRALAKVYWTPGFPSRSTRLRHALSTLGPPDDVLEFGDDALDRSSGGAALRPQERLLRWGTKGHGTFPTLGEILVEANGQIANVRGGWGMPPVARVVSEDELRTYIPLVDEMPEPAAWGIGPENWDPLPVMRIVNRLRSLGKAKAVAIVSEYHRVNAVVPSGSGAPKGRYRTGSDDFVPRRDDAVLALMAVLFEEPEDLQHYSSYNQIEIKGGIPFLLPGWNERKQEPPGTHTTFPAQVGNYLKSGRIRKAPLCPSARPTDVIAAMDRELDSTRRRQVRNQFLRLLRPAFSVPTDLRLESYLTEAELETRWQRISGDPILADLRWDPTGCCYSRRPW